MKTIQLIGLLFWYSASSGVVMADPPHGAATSPAYHHGLDYFLSHPPHQLGTNDAVQETNNRLRQRNADLYTGMSARELLANYRAVLCTARGEYGHAECDGRAMRDYDDTEIQKAEDILAY